MKNIRLYQSSKYDTKRYDIVNFIYFKDNKDNSICIPMVGDIEKLDNVRDILKKICEKFITRCLYYEKLTIDNKVVLLFELRGTMEKLINATEMLGKSVTPIYVGGEIFDIYIE